jgi:hypothetical protein
MRPIGGNEEVDVNKESSTGFVEIICRLFDFVWQSLTSVSKFEFNGLFLSEINVIIHHWIALFMLDQKSLEVNSI